MIKKMTCMAFVACALNACVSLSEFGELEQKFNKLQAENAETTSAKARLEIDIAALTVKLNKLQSERDQLQMEQDALQASYDALSSKSSQKILSQIADNQKLLAELKLKEELLAGEIKRVNDLKQLIADKEAQMTALKTALSKALLNFEGKGLTVIQKNGKIYVSMENKLLFKSGSWAVGDEGREAVEQLASVLSQNKDIDVLIEGHTDNVPYSSSGQLIDNWDLSVKRATAIVRILEEGTVDPAKITAAGRSEHIAIAENETSEGRAKNRRIEIILAPNLDEVSKLLSE